MSMTAGDAVNAYADQICPRPGRVFITVPDAERLLLQSRFVKCQLEAEILADIEALIMRATLVDPADAPPDLVTMNSTIALREVDTGNQHIFTLVFPSCANGSKSRISVLTPLGSILLGARTGQILTCPLSGTITTVRVESILHQPEATGDYYG